MNSGENTNVYFGRLTHLFLNRFILDLFFPFHDETNARNTARTTYPYKSAKHCDSLPSLTKKLEIKIILFTLNRNHKSLWQEDLGNHRSFLNAYINVTVSVSHHPRVQIR